MLSEQSKMFSEFGIFSTGKYQLITTGRAISSRSYFYLKINPQFNTFGYVTIYSIGVCHVMHFTTFTLTKNTREICPEGK